MSLALNGTLANSCDNETTTLEPGQEYALESWLAGSSLRVFLAGDQVLIYSFADNVLLRTYALDVCATRRCRLLIP